METQNIVLNYEAVTHKQSTSATAAFNKEEVIHELKHYLPAQAPLKDFIHHNTLHAFQHLKFHTAIQYASELFGYNVSLPLTEYRSLFEKKVIREEVLHRVIEERKGADNVKEWKQKLLYTEYRNTSLPRIGAFRSYWKKKYQIDLDALTHTTLFRVTCSYLDQGISIWNFPVWHKGFLKSIREIERNSFTSFFRTSRARKILLDNKLTLEDLLHLLVRDEAQCKQYLFDQQFAHQGWSGMVSTVEDQPQTLLDHKKITLEDFIYFELLLEVDALDYQLGDDWKPLAASPHEEVVDLFAPVKGSELQHVLSLWQDAYEWSYYDEVLTGLQKADLGNMQTSDVTFQSMFCIDDRECSLKRYLEKVDPKCETFSTPGFFGVEFFFKPEHGKFYTKLCPAPVTPNYLIKEEGTKGKKDEDKDHHFNKHSHKLFGGWLITQTLGFWSAFKLFLNIFRPTASPATATSFNHMDKVSKLTIENHSGQKENNLQVGFTIEEMATRVEALLKSIGLVKNFAPIVYVVGHGSSSVNNPHYAAYDCGACSGRPGSVNARVVCHMANHPKVREILQTKGIVIPHTTQFVGGLHDTSRDEIAFYDEDSLSKTNLEMHEKYVITFERALQQNAKERSRRFDSINTRSSLSRIHKKIKQRSVSLFEPRPELNHATNTLCIVGRRGLTKHLFLDRRAFMNSYDYNIDPDGKYLFTILKAAAPVCGGINLEYFFSRVDNQKLGAGTKLPHNVMGLFGVANGIEGDLRPGLPSQMIEVHDPIRLMIVVEHNPEVVLETIKRNDATYEWFINEWIHLVVIDPDDHKQYVFKDGAFTSHKPLKQNIDVVSDLTKVLESNTENLPVYLMA